MRDKYVEKSAGGAWFEFGVHKETGNVDVASSECSVFENVPRQLAEKVIAERARFLSALCEILKDY